MRHRWALGALLCVGATSCVTPPATHEVEIRDFQFHIPDRTIAAGDTLVWINRDLVFHRVSFDGVTSPDLEPNGRWPTAVTRSGVVDCPFHPSMRTTLTVR